MLPTSPVRMATVFWKGSSVRRADRIIATGDGLSNNALRASSPKAELAMYPGSAAAPAEAVSLKNEAVAPAITQQQPPSQRHDYGIGF